MLLSIAAAIIIFATLIIVHETGHFLMAKRLGVRVLRFSVGYPPRVFGIRRGETDYAFGATPLGGYVKMLGDEIAETPSTETLQNYLGEIKLDLLGAAKASGWLGRSGKAADAALAAMATLWANAGDGAVTILGRAPKAEEQLLLRQIDQRGAVALAIETLAESPPAALIDAFNSRAFPSQSLGRRFAIVLAGPAANILFAPLLMIAVFMIGVPTTLPVLGEIRADLPGHAAGLQSGDDVLAVDGRPIASWDELSRAVKKSEGHPVQLSIKRIAGGQASTLQLTVTPKLTPEQTIYGNEAPTWVIGVTPRGDESVRQMPPLQAISAGTVETLRMTGTLFVGIAKIIEGATPVRQALGGPIMIAEIAGKEAHQGFADAALFMVMLSLELGIMNLLPIPLLDGGHLLFFTFEGIRGEPLKLRHREIAMQIGLFLLAILMVFVIINDLSRHLG